MNIRGDRYPDTGGDETIDKFADEVTERITDEEAISCQLPFIGKRNRKKVGRRILEDLKKDFPDYPWDKWEPHFEEVWK